METPVNCGGNPGQLRRTPMEHFSVGPPPNRTCGFHRIRLSSV